MSSFISASHRLKCWFAIPVLPVFLFLCGVRVLTGQPERCCRPFLTKKEGTSSGTSSVPYPVYIVWFILRGPI